MPSFDPSRAAANPNLDLKKVTWLELFFDLIFALALAMSAKPLESIGDGSTNTFFAFLQFILIYCFLIIFWYRHMALINRFKRSSFLTEVITLFIGFLVIIFVQFLRIWRVNAPIGSYLATVTIFLIAASTSCLYFLFSLKIHDGGENEKRWARASGRYMLLESIGYLTAIIATPGIRPFWFVAVFLYFNRYTFMLWLNPKSKPTIPVELQNVPTENIPHKAERMGLFSLLVYGLIIALAATPLMTINLSSAEGILTPILSFGILLFFISIVWYIHYRLYELAQPKGHQFTVMTFITLGLLVITTHFLRTLLLVPSNFVAILFAVCTGLLVGVLGTIYWNIPMMTGIAASEPLKVTFRRWAYFLYIFATAFFISCFFPAAIRTLIWQSVLLLTFIGLLIDRGLNVHFYMGTRVLKNRKYFDYQTATGLGIVFFGLVLFFVLTILFEKAIASLWTLIWITPIVVGFFIMLNHWLFKRVRPN